GWTESAVETRDQAGIGLPVMGNLLLTDFTLLEMLPRPRRQSIVIEGKGHKLFVSRGILMYTIHHASSSISMLARSHRPAGTPFVDIPTGAGLLLDKRGSGEFFTYHFFSSSLSRQRIWSLLRSRRSMILRL